MNILLTGATGFLGSNLLIKLLNLNHNVIILKRSFSNTWRIKEYLSKVKYYDINKINLEEIFNKNNIEMIIHTATSYGRKKESMTEIINSNIVFPLSLLEIGMKNNVQYFINTDTYFNRETVFSTNIQYYVKTKKDFIQYSKEVINKSKIKFFNIRLEHLFGEKDNDSKVIPFFIKRMLKNESLNLTPGEQKRDFIYIDDAVNAYIIIIDNVKKIKAKNNICLIEVGTGTTIKLKEFIETTKEIIQSKSKVYFGAIPYRQNEIMESKANINFLKKYGWKIKTNMQDAILKTVEYYKNEKSK